MSAVKKQYLIRAQNLDGTWYVNEDEIYNTKREAEKVRKHLRIMAGIQSQLWSYEGWMKNCSTSKM